MADLTVNFKFTLPDFNKRFWHDEINNDLITLDALLKQYLDVSGVLGVWINSTAYAVGAVVVDPTLGTLFRAETAHTSAATGTFAEARIASPTLWAVSTVTNRFRGAFVASIAYRPGDFVVSGNKYGVATQSFTSAATYAIDEAAARFATLIDLSAIPNSVVPVPNPSTALNYVRQNPAGDGYEVRTPAQTRADIGAGTGNGSIVGPGSSTDRSIALWNGTGATAIKDGPALGSAGHILQSSGAGADPAFVAPAIIQTVYSEYLTYAALSVFIPFDDTIPQITEGTEILTATITPKRSTSRMRIRFRGSCSGAVGCNNMSAALFQDAITNALSAAEVANALTNQMVNIGLEYEHAPGTASAIIYRIRVGPEAASMVMNGGSSTARRFGGVSGATLVVEEIFA